MKLLVIGGAGYIGSATTKTLLDAGHEVVVLDNLSKGHKEAVPAAATLVTGDLGDQALIKRLAKEHGFEGVLHFAAWAAVGESVVDPAAYFDNNSVRTKALLDALLECGVKRFIFSSTAAVYGEPQELPIPETHPKAPTNPYGWSKLFVEEILRSYGEAYGLEAIALRYFNAAGALQGMGEDHDPETHLIPLVLQVALDQRENIKMFGSDWDTPDGTCVRDYIHIADLANAHLLAAEHLAAGKGSGVFNLGNGEGHTVKQVIEAARQITGHPIPAQEAPRRAGDPARLVASSQKAREVLGWQPRFPEIESIIESAWQWHNTHPRGYASE